MRRFPLLLFLLAVAVIPAWNPALAAQTATSVAPARKAILVTGASSGIGRVTTELLASRGFFVYAGARKEKDLAALNALENVQAIRLDVTIPAEIEAAVQTVKDGGRGLFGLINNAGVVVMAPLMEVSEEDLCLPTECQCLGPLPRDAGFRATPHRKQGADIHNRLPLRHRHLGIRRSVHDEQVRHRSLHRCTRCGNGTL
jgi:hypothetical protein